MPASNDYLFQNFDTAQGSQNPKPVTIASATTIAPTGFVTVVSGSAAIVNITPPLDGAHMLVLIPAAAAAFTMTAAGNIALLMAAATPGQPVFLIYNPNTAKYYAGKITSA